MKSTRESSIGPLELFGSVCLWLMLSVVVPAARADTVALGTTSAGAEVAFSTGNFCDQSGLSSASCILNGSTAMANVLNGMGGFVSASTQIMPEPQQGALANIDYYFAVEGSTATNVPIAISGLSSAIEGSGPFATAWAFYAIVPIGAGSLITPTIFAPPDECAALEQEYSAPCAQLGSFTLNALVPSNTEFRADLAVTAKGSYSSVSLSDPIIAIDPSFGVSGFTVVANPGVFSVPEPSSLELLGLCVGVLSIWRVARTKKT